MIKTLHSTHKKLLKKTDIPYTMLTKIKAIVINNPSIFIMVKISKALIKAADKMIK